MRLVYTRRRDRLHALISPKKRRKLEMMQRYADYSLAELQREHNLILGQIMLYGCAYIKPHLHSSDEM